MPKTEQMTVAFTQWDRWKSYVIKHMITTERQESALLKTD